MQLRETAARWQAEGIDETTAAARLAAMPERAGRTAAELQTDHALRSRAYALLHLDVEVIDPVVDGSALAGIDTTSPSRPRCSSWPPRCPGEAFPSAHEARLAESHPGVSVVRVRAPGTASTTNGQVATRTWSDFARSMDDTRSEVERRLGRGARGAIETSSEGAVSARIADSALGVRDARGA